MAAAIHPGRPQVTFLPRDANATLGRKAMERLHTSVKTAVKVAGFGSIILNGFILADMVVSLDKVYHYSSFATVSLYFCVSYEVNAIFFRLIDAMES